ncbi:hypothetical protein Clocel_4073 [Clostridium cellulovorans 743B]|uniref:Uncharacterized protein n=2 Tax=Clostridium cellulovorans TaxID=1493 RepID=D9SM79_CLOC7|nr:hypothetical protein Clocel_4073 [Clostridium cellulovorans 743B]
MKKILLIVVACIMGVYGLVEVTKALEKEPFNPLMQTESTYRTLEKIDLSDPYYKANNIVEGYTIPENLDVRCKYTDSSLLVTTSDSHYVKNQFSLPEGIYEYNFKTEEMKLIADKVKKKNHIKTVAYDDGYLVWEEDGQELISEVNDGRGWKMYLKNIDTGKVIKIDQYSKKNSSYASGGYKFSPNDIDIDGENIVYKIDAVNEKKETIHIVKSYNIKTKELKEIKRSNSINKDTFSEPDVDGDKVVFCGHSIDSNDSQIYIYDINSGIFDVIWSTEDEKDFNNAKISEDTVTIAKSNCKTYNYNGYSFTSKVVLYDINKRAFEPIRDPEQVKWESGHNGSINLFNDKYLTFSTGDNSNTKIYDMKAKKYIDLLREEEKNEYLIEGVGESYDNLVMVDLWKSEYTRKRVYILEKENSMS